MVSRVLTESGRNARVFKLDGYVCLNEYLFPLFINALVGQRDKQGKIMVKMELGIFERVKYFSPYLLMFRCNLPTILKISEQFFRDLSP